MRLRKLRSLLIAALCIGIVIIVFPACTATAVNNSQSAQADMVISFIDVGQADCILIQSPNGKNMLIDAGNNEDSATILKYIKDKGIKTIDVLVGTHPHEDHIGSMDDIIKSFNIGNIYMPKVTTNTATFLNVLKAVKEKGLKISTPTAGSKIEMDKDLDITVLAPNDTAYKDLNDYSIVLKVKFKNNSFLFTGDAEAVSEAEILRTGYDIKADVLKVAHHGSHSSTSAAFLKAVAPKTAIISVGKDNDYGHPAQDMLDRLKSSNIEIFRTDVSGTIIVNSDGTNIKINGTPAKEVKTANEAAPPVAMPALPQTLYIGNKNSKVFHLPNCGTLPQLGNQVRFDSREAAIKASYKPCGRCKP